MNEHDAVIETNRLRLRRIRPSDYAALCRILQDEATMYAYNGAFTDEEARAWLDRQIARYEETGFGLWAVDCRDVGEMIGQCGLTMQPWKDRQVLEIGYLLRRTHWHMGYATEAARACRDYAFDRLNADEVYSIIRDTNAASQNVARRIGMTAVDTWTKHYRGADMPHILFSVKRTQPTASPAD